MSTPTKICKDGYIVNPNTRRCVKKDGKVGRSLNKSPKSKLQKICKGGYIVNPKTGRCVKKDGKIGRSLKKSPKASLQKNNAHSEPVVPIIQMKPTVVLVSHYLTSTHNASESVRNKLYTSLTFNYSDVFMKSNDGLPIKEIFIKLVGKTRYTKYCSELLGKLPNGCILLFNGYGGGSHSYGDMSVEYFNFNDKVSAFRLVNGIMYAVDMPNKFTSEEFNIISRVVN